MSDADLNLKLAAFGLFKSGKSAREVSEDLEEVTYAKALKWKKELEDAEKNKELVTLLQAKDTTIERVADETIEELKRLAQEPDEIEVLKGEVEQAKKAVDTYQMLNEDLMTTAQKLSMRIRILSPLVTDVNELLVLTEALAKLQESFFNKNQYNVNVFPGMTAPIANDRVSMFKELKKA